MTVNGTPEAGEKGTPAAPQLRWSRRQSLRGRLTAFVVLPIGLICAFIFLFFPARQEQQAIDALANRARSIGEMTAFTIGPALYFEDSETIDEALATARQNQDLMYLGVLDGSGNFAAGYNWERFQSGGVGRPGEDEGVSSDTTLYEAVVPIIHGGAQTGWVHIGLSLEEVREETAANRRTIALISVVVFLMGIVAVYGFSSVVTRKLGNMVDTFDRISAGDLSQRAPTKTDDELGDLARSFNRMVDSLARAHGELGGMNEELEARVAHRTRELEREIVERQAAEARREKLEMQLRQAQKMDALGQLTAGIAHNFNNMLMAIMGGVDLAMLRAPERLQQGLGDVAAVTQRAADMVRQLMTFARISSSGPAKRLDLLPLIENAVEICQHTFDRQFTIEIQGPQALPGIIGDRSQLEQVFVNLFLNARDALEQARRVPAKILVIVDSLQIDDEEGKPAVARPGPHLRVRVQDDGIGMDEDTRRRAFDPFFTTKAADKGTGLGLATSYAIVQDHEGWIECESQLNKGTTFAVYLPAAKRATVVQDEKEEDVVPLRGTETVLVIEDEEVVRNTLSAMLERLGYAVLAASDGQEGLAVLQRDLASIDLVLLDLSMTGISGQEVLARMRTLAPDTKVLIVTGHAAREDEFVGAVGVVHKPFTTDELARRVREAVDG